MALDIVPLHSEKRMIVGEELRLRFKLFDAQTGRSPVGLERIQILMFQPADGRQGHGWAGPIGNGLYEATFPAPGAGVSYLFFACPKSKVGYAQLPHLILQTSEAGITAVSRTPVSAPPALEC